MKENIRRQVEKLLLVIACLLTVAFCKSVKAEAKVSIAAGVYNTGLIKQDGSLWTAGRNDYGQLGNGKTGTNQKKPIKAMTSVSQVAFGSEHTGIIKKDGSLWMCGNNEDGQLGDGTESDRNKPKKVMSGVAAVSAGNYYTAIIKKDGSLWMCGSNEYGQLGDGTESDRSTPKKIMEGVASVSAGYRHTGIVKKDGSLWMCGNNGWGELGDGTMTDRKVPKKIMSGVASVSSGGDFTAIVKKDGSLWTCGYNEFGQLGDGIGKDLNKPKKIMSSVSSVRLGEDYGIAVKKDGSLWVWGNNEYGQLGDGTENSHFSPKKLSNFFVKETYISAQSRTVSEKSKSFNIGAKTNGNKNLSYSSGNKKVVQVDARGNVKIVGCGQATITIKAANTAAFGSAEKKIVITVVPKKGKLKKVVSPDKKKMTIQWAKSKNISGYVVQIGEKKSFSGKKVQRTLGAKATKIKLSPFKSKKKYYVRIRTYKKVGAKKYYSAWSNSKSVTVK